MGHGITVPCPCVNPPDRANSSLRSRGYSEIIGKKRMIRWKVHLQPVLGEQFILVQAVVGS